MKIWIVREIWINNIFFPYIDKIFIIKKNAENYVQTKTNPKNFDILEMETK